MQPSDQPLSQTIYEQVQLTYRTYGRISLIRSLFCANSYIIALQEMKDFWVKFANFINGVQQILAENDCLRKRVATLEETIEKQKNDPWTSRVTYENTVDQIASFEDASKRDDARRVIEPMLKKSQVAQLRRDIKKRVKELNEESGNTFNNYGIYNEVQSGGININNKKDGGY